MISVEHELLFEQKEPTPLTPPKFWSVGYTDEIEWPEQLTGKTVIFRGGEWIVDMVAEQESFPDRVAGVKKHPENTQAELVATEKGRQRIRTWQGEVVGRDEMVGPLTREELKEAKLYFVEEQGADPWLKLVHPIKGTFRQAFSVIMPGGNHQAAYSNMAKCVAIKLSKKLIS